MKSRLPAPLLAAALVSAVTLQPGLSSAPGRSIHLAPAAEEGSAEGPDQAEKEGEEGPRSPVTDWLWDQRAEEDGTIPFGAYARALRQAEAVESLTARRAPELVEAEWQHMGPTNFGGRVADVAVDPTRENTAYAATASGGLWRSTDAGTAWQHAWPPDTTQAMGAVAVGSDGVVYAGTGEPNPGGGSIVFGGMGVYRSADGGETWEHVGLSTSGAIGRIAVDPSDPDKVFVAAAGNLFVPGGERGLYRSTDGGTTWELVLPGENDTTGAVDVAVDPHDPGNLLVAMWDHVRLPTHRVYAGPGSGVFRSADGGDTWEEVELPGNVAPDQVGRIGVAFAPSDPDRAYAVVANRLDGTAVGLWRSDDGGATWERTSASPSSLSQSVFGWWFGKVFVDPADPDRLFVAGVELMESTNGGDRFLAQSSTLAGIVTGLNQIPVHADQHGMAWDPNVPGRVYLGNDGGMYRSDANGNVGTWVFGALQGWTQHYSVDVSEQNPGRVVTGLQDNMCQRNSAGGNVGHPHTWTKYGLCGDGLQTLINPEQDRIVYGCAQYGANCTRSPDGGTAFTFLPRGTSDRWGWWAPLLFDPSDPEVMYKAGNRVNRSTDAGSSWTVISPDLTTNPEQLDPNPSYRIYGTITTVAVAPSDPNVIYVGTDDGLLWRTPDLGETWVRLSDGDEENDLPGTWVTRMAVDPEDADVAYATFSGFRAGDDTPHVVKTADGGRTWTNISGNLPAAPVNDVIVIGGRLAVATDVGVFLTRDGGATWLRVGSNLPAVPVFDIRYHGGTSSITAATFGHGIQRVTLPE